MQQVNNDMDDLFRRAAEGYPLNTNSADWHTLGKKISIGKTETATPSSNNNHRHLLWLLLLVPAVGLYYYVSVDKPAEKLLSTYETGAKKNNLKSRAVVKQTGPAENVKIPYPPLQQSVSMFTTSKKYNLNQNSMKGNLSSILPEPAITVTEPPMQLPVSKVNERATVVNNGKETTVHENEPSGIKNNINKQPDKVEPGTETEKTVSNLHGKKNKKQSPKGIYAGIMIGPEINTVKFQPVKNTGGSIGLLIGYQFNKTVSVESGISWSKKYYYSDGKYFNTKNVSLPAYAQVKKIEGSCNMLEVPIAIRYNFNSSAKTNLSVSAGLSSYIMKKESYTYTVERNGVQYPRKATYSNSSIDLFAVVNIGFGVDHKIGRTGFLRLEPYLKLPVKGVGIGDLPLMSSGINFAITKKLF